MPNISDTVRTVLVDDNQESLFILQMFLRGKATNNVEIVGTANSTHQLLNGIQEQGWQPDLIIMDNRLGDGIDGIEATRRVIALRPQVKVVMLSSQPYSGIDPTELELFRAAKAAGASGYYFKEDLPVQPQVFQDMILAVASGTDVLGKQIAGIAGH